MVQWPHGVEGVSSMTGSSIDACFSLGESCVRMSKTGVDSEPNGFSNGCEAAIEFRRNRQHAYRAF